MFIRRRCDNHNVVKSTVKCIKSLDSSGKNEAWERDGKVFKADKSFCSNCQTNKVSISDHYKINNAAESIDSMIMLSQNLSGEINTLHHFIYDNLLFPCNKRTQLFMSNNRLRDSRFHMRFQC